MLRRRAGVLTRRGPPRPARAALALALGAWLAIPAGAQPHRHGAGGHAPGAHGHVHAELPASYASVPVPAGIWADPGTLARGKAIWAARCASCHGERGDGRGPAAAALAVKPGDLADAAMVRDMSPRYWFWRVSEGGQVPLFRAAGSAMPAWKAELSVADRWAVIAYAHGFSGVRPRVPAGPRSEPGRRP